MCMIGLEILFSIQKYSFQWQKYVKHFVDFFGVFEDEKKILLLTFKASKMITTFQSENRVSKCALCKYHILFCGIGNLWKFWMMPKSILNDLGE